LWSAAYEKGKVRLGMVIEGLANPEKLEEVPQEATKRISPSLQNAPGSRIQTYDRPISAIFNVKKKGNKRMCMSKGKGGSRTGKKGSRPSKLDVLAIQGKDVPGSKVKKKR